MSLAWVPHSLFSFSSSLTITSTITGIDLASTAHTRSSREVQPSLSLVNTQQKCQGSHRRRHRRRRNRRPLRRLVRQLGSLIISTTRPTAGGMDSCIATV